MAPIAKDSEVSTLGGAPASQETAGRTQPVALEVPVSVNGARTVDGSDKREPFSETSKTVLIFASGAVIRLASTVAAGQLLFLTNENTKKEVVCQVVKSKNYRSVSGYVELEFTEPAAGFWGMRFPTERPAPAPNAAAQSSLPAVANTPKIAPPTQAGLPSIPRPVAPVNVPPAGKPLAPAPPVATVNQPAAASLSSMTHSTTSPAKPAADSETEALKREAARLQEQLSGLLFAQNAGANAPALKPDTPATSESKAKVIEMAHRPEPVANSPFVSRNIPATSSPQRGTLDLASEEVKIPAWLEPLARNSASTALETPHTTEPESFDAPVPHEDPAPAGIPGFPEESSAPVFGTSLFGEESASLKGSGKSGKGLLIGLVAAGVLAAAAGGTWYFGFRHPQAATPQTSAPVFATLPQTDRTSSVNTQTAAMQTGSAPSNFTSAPTSVNANQTRPASGGGSASVVDAREKERIESVKPEARNPEVKAAEQAKKPVLGDVRLVAPNVSAQEVSGESVAAPHLGGGAPTTAAATPGSDLLAANSGQPAAPMAIGGDVKTARLLHSVPPVYPPLARNQRVSGDVKIDALVDAAGHVTTMKVVSGPVLLHQAAMDALRQWRYQPAMLDEKPVPMHLTVTVQFRLQQ